MTPRLLCLGPADGPTVVEQLRQDTCRVRSRSGLHRTEKALIEDLDHWPAGPVLVVGNRSGILPLVLLSERPGQPVTSFLLDLHHAGAAARTLAVNGLAVEATASAGPANRSWQAGCITIACAPDLPPDAVAAACLQHVEGEMPGELTLDLLEQMHGRLVSNGLCLVAADGETEWLQTQLRKLLGSVHVRKADGGVSLLSGRKKGPLKRRRDFRAWFEVGVPGGEVVHVQTRPGVFCHRRPDEGGLALAEVAVRKAPKEGAILDLGCGSGMVGLLLARNTAARRTVFVDAFSRAIACAMAGAERNSLSGCEFLLSDSGIDKRAGFDLCAANPPYFSDYRIADLFVQTAASVLRPGGRACFVAKNTVHLEHVMAETFASLEVMPRRGYRVVVATQAAGGRR